MRLKYFTGSVLDNEKVTFKKLLGQLKLDLNSESFDPDQFDRRFAFLRSLVEKSEKTTENEPFTQEIDDSSRVRAYSIGKIKVFQG